MNLFAKASLQFVRCPFGVVGKLAPKISMWLNGQRIKDDQQLEKKMGNEKHQPTNAAESFYLQIMINSLQCDLAMEVYESKLPVLHTMAIIHSSTCRTHCASHFQTQFRRPCKIWLWKLNFHNVDRHIEFTDKSWKFHWCMR